MPFGNKVIVVWDEKASGLFNLYYRVYSDGSWSSKKVIYNTSMHSQWPQLAKDSNDKIHMTWMEGTSRSNREIYYANYSNGKWSGREKVYASAWNSTWPRIGADSNNTIHVIWGHDISSARGNNDTYHAWKTSRWSSPINASKTSGTISIHGALYVRNLKQYALWMDGHEMNWKLLYSQRSGGNWSSPVQVSSGHWPSITADSAGNVHVLHSQISGDVYYIKRTNGVWGKKKTVNSAYHQRNFVCIDIDNDDTLHGAWRQTYKNHNNIFYASADINGNWNTPQLVSNGTNCKTPVIKPDNNGYVHIVWYDVYNEETERADIFYTCVESGQGGISSESPIAVFNYSPKFGAPPLKVNFDATGSYDPDGDIVSYIWNFGDGQTGDQMKIDHTYSKKGSYKATLTITDDSGLTASEYNYVYVSEPPVAKFDMDRNKGVAPLTINFNASKSYDPDGTIKNYYWEFGDDSTGSGKTISHTYTEPGYYAVFLTVYDNYSISSTTSNLIEVYRVHSPLNIKVESKLNRNLFFREYLNTITWDPNPYNAEHGIEIVKYNIYRKIKGQAIFEYRNTVVSNIFVFLDRGLNESNKDSFGYAITAVDSEGHESYIENSSSSYIERLLFKKSIN
jgi:PKD repeat protein